MKQATLNIGRTILAWLSYTMTKSVPASQSLFHFGIQNFSILLCGAYICMTEHFTHIFHFNPIVQAHCRKCVPAHVNGQISIKPCIISNYFKPQIVLLITDNRKHIIIFFNISIAGDSNTIK